MLEFQSTRYNNLTTGNNLMVKPKKVTFFTLFIFILLYPLLEGISNQFIPVGTKYLGLLVIAIWCLETVQLQYVKIVTSIPLFLIYIIWNAISVFWSHNTGLSVDRVIEILQVFLLYWIILDVTNSKEYLIKLMEAYFLGIFLLSLTALFNILNGQTFDGLYNRFSAFGYDPNNFGILVVSSIPIALAVYSLKGKLWLGILYTIISIPLVLSSASRGALIAIVIVLVSYFFIFIRSFKKGFAIGLILLIGIILTFYFVPVESLTRITDNINDPSAGGRTQAWQLAINLGDENPLTGIGAGSFLSVSNTYFSSVINVHNTFLSHWAELGILGVLLWVCLWLLHFKYIVNTKVNKENFELKIGLLLSVISALIGALFLNWEVRKTIYILWGLCVALKVLRVRRLDNFEIKKETKN
ncbi:O-antigen ligase family protein [Priestia megaterium]|uniref:O-antigen ligase family protein n=1 Tax=Priestia megaterium TaxID=1404 RepID=UPI0031FD8707